MLPAAPLKRYFCFCVLPQDRKATSSWHSLVFNGCWPPHSFYLWSLYNFPLNTGGWLLGLLLFWAPSSSCLFSSVYLYSLLRSKCLHQVCADESRRGLSTLFSRLCFNMHPTHWAPSAWAAHQLSTFFFLMGHFFSHLMLVQVTAWTRFQGLNIQLCELYFHRSWPLILLWWALWDLISSANIFSVYHRFIFL